MWCLNLFQVQRTNNSSMVSKRSAATQGYFQDGYLQHLVGKGTRRTPLINRSTLKYSVIFLVGLAIAFSVLQYPFEMIIRQYNRLHCRHTQTIASRLTIMLAMHMVTLFQKHNMKKRCTS